MAGYGSGASPRKQMASGDGGNFGVETPFGHAGDHPDRSMGAPTLDDDSRGVGKPVAHSRDSHPAQAAPDHGPMHPGGYNNYQR